MTYLQKSFALYLAAIVPFSCGTEDEREDVARTSLSSSDALSSESVSTNLTDALEVLVDSNIGSSSSTGLALQNQSSKPDLVRTKSCTVSGNNAVVNISTTISGSTEFDTRRRSISRTVDGSSSVVKTWSKTDSSVLCNESGVRAAIDWSAEDISGLSLSAAIERNKSTESSRTRISDGATSTKSRTTTATGSRNVTWISHTNNDDGTFTRVKSVSSSMTRTRSIASSDSATIDLTMTVATENDQELQITVVRDSTTRALRSKLIASGTLRAYENQDSYVLTSFDNYLLEFTESDCAPKSGKLTSQFFDSSSDQATKTIELVVSDGAYTLSDVTDPSNPIEIDDFDYSLCDIRSFN